MTPEEDAMMMLLVSGSSQSFSVNSSPYHLKEKPLGGKNRLLALG